MKMMKVESKMGKTRGAVSTCPDLKMKTCIPKHRKGFPLARVHHRGPTHAFRRAWHLGLNALSL